jgi:hypothetical protein
VPIRLVMYVSLFARNNFKTTERILVKFDIREFHWNMKIHSRYHWNRMIIKDTILNTYAHLQCNSKNIYCKERYFEQKLQKKIKYISSWIWFSLNFTIFEIIKRKGQHSPKFLSYAYILELICYFRTISIIHFLYIHYEMYAIFQSLPHHVETLSFQSVCCISDSYTKLN